ncbi:conserved hypothetical protein [Ricinus communis]|uniref:Uncharacterized protein n=1 Tax=Ricinus communis TaxID=3988 RepID=B9SLC9_RICCO|nr:conserved hypothetical protein [Ricinus communis]
MTQIYILRELGSVIQFTALVELLGLYQRLILTKRMGYMLRALEKTRAADILSNLALKYDRGRVVSGDLLGEENSYLVPGRGSPWYHKKTKSKKKKRKNQVGSGNKF